MYYFGYDYNNVFFSNKKYFFNLKSFLIYFPTFYLSEELFDIIYNFVRPNNIPALFFFLILLF